MKELEKKVNKYKANKKKKTLKKKIRRALRKVFNKKVMTKVLIILSGLALIASYTLPYIIR
jgi:mRNA degradation ribonuclease J1/J2